MLGIDNYQQCCEGFGAECTLGERFEEEKFVESIEFDIDRDDSFTVKINIKDESPIYASVYNIHNGYYAHAIYYTDSSLKIDCFEKDYFIMDKAVFNRLVERVPNLRVLSPSRTYFDPYEQEVIVS